MPVDPSRLVTEPVAAFLSGVVWVIIRGIYGTVRNAGAVPDLENESTVGIVADTLVVGGGTGVVLYLTSSVLSAFQYGLAGIVLTTIVFVIGTRFRERTMSA